MSAVESRQHRRNTPSAAVPCRHPIRCQPSDFVPCCWAPLRHSHSPPICSLDSVPCRSHSSLAVVLSLKVVSTRQRILLIPLLPSLCRHNFAIFMFVTFRCLSADTMWARLNSLVAYRRQAVHTAVPEELIYEARYRRWLISYQRSSEHDYSYVQKKDQWFKAQYCSEWTELWYGTLVRFLCSEMTMMTEPELCEFIILSKYLLLTDL